MLLATKMMQGIAILIMLHTTYVESIRNAVVSSQNNYDSNAAFDATTQSSFFPSHQTTETMTEARQSTSFRPSQFLQFTTSDASGADFSSTQNYPLYNSASAPVDAEYPQAVETRFSQSDSQFAFPSEQQQTAFTATSKYNNYNTNNNNFNNKYNYNTNTQSYNPNATPTQLQSTPILTYLDPYTNENYQSAAGGGGGGQEYTVHSSIAVQSHGPGSLAPTYQREPPSAASYQHSSYATRPSYATQPSNDAFAHKYDDIRHQYSQRPNALPNDERELPAAPAHLSYASKDYPPPSYLQHSNQSPPQRQDFSAATSAVSPNYANNNNFNSNLGNYVQVAQQQQHKLSSGNYQARPQPSYTSSQYSPVRPNYQPARDGPPQPPPSYTSSQYPPGRPYYQPAREGSPQPSRPSYNNYYGYQQGEIPPPYVQPGYRPGPSPYRPLQQAPPQASGLASLGSLFTTTQQYAPQFTNLLLNGVVGGAGGGGNNNALTSLLGAFTGGNGASSSARPVNLQLIKALEHIARNDDLQCVPKVLCQMIAGQMLRGQLPTFATSPAITNFLSAIPTSSPALIYGRAALLGISGGVQSCQGTYGKCPKSEDEILYYLNNHRGGFFKLFNEPEPEPEQPQESISSPSSPSSDSSSLFGIWSLLTGNPSPKPTTPRPKPRPTTASADITSGIGNFFTNVLSQYLGGVEYQRRRRRRSLDAIKDETDNEAELKQETDEEDFHDEEDSADTQDEPSDYEDIEGRILHKDIVAEGPKFFPENIEKIRNSFNTYNREAASKKLKFPSSTADREFEVAQLLEEKRRGKQLQQIDENINFVEDNNEEQIQNSQTVRFIDDSEEDQYASNTNLYSNKNAAPTRGGRMIFPDHYDQHIRKGKILNRPSYAADYGGYADQDRLVVSDEKRKASYESLSNTQSTNNNYYAQQAYLTPNRYTNVQYQGTDSSYNDNNRASNHNYDYPNNNYLANNRYSSANYPNARTTSRPIEEDKNVYVTNSKGTNEYYITPDGRKIYY